MGVVVRGQWLGVSWKNAQAALSSSRASDLQPPASSLSPANSSQWLVASGQLTDIEVASRVSSLQPPACSLQSSATRGSRRAGITLLEVLISMGVLLIGLMGVGAMIPAGRYEIMQGVKTDYSTTVGRAAFRDLKARGYLNPSSWSSTTGAALFPPSKIFDVSIGGEQVAVAIDPLGITAPGGGFGPNFPNPAPNPVPVPSLARIYLYQAPNPPPILMTKNVADTVFRCSDDLVTVPSLLGSDRPPVQQSVPFNVDPLAPLNPIMSRSSEGNYSWLATIVTDSNASALNSKVTVSVVVFYKRELIPSATKEAVADAMLLGGSEFRLDLSNATTKFPEGLRAGQWIMLAGETGGQRQFRWYRVQGAAKIHMLGARPMQDITLAGADWNPALATRAWLFEGVIAVYEKNMQLEIE